MIRQKYTKLLWDTNSENSYALYLGVVGHDDGTQHDDGHDPVGKKSEAKITSTTWTRVLDVVVVVTLTIGSASIGR